MVQRCARYPRRPAAAARSANPSAHQPGEAVRRVPHGPAGAGDEPGAVHRHPAGGAGGLLHLAPLAAGPRHQARGGARHPGEDLFQKRERQPGGQPQAQLGRCPGLLQHARGRQTPDHRDRRGPVGFGPVVRHHQVRPGVQGVHGAGLLRPEALPQVHHAGLRRRSGRQPEPGHQNRPRPAGRVSRHPRLARHGHLRGARRCQQP